MVHGPVALHGLDTLAGLEVPDLRAAIRGGSHNVLEILSRADSSCSTISLRFLAKRRRKTPRRPLHSGASDSKSSKKELAERPLEAPRGLMKPLPRLPETRRAVEAGGDQQGAIEAQPGTGNVRAMALAGVHTLRRGDVPQLRGAVLHRGQGQVPVLGKL